jgi:hypothetical protein
VSLTIKGLPIHLPQRILYTAFFLTIFGADPPQTVCFCIPASIADKRKLRLTEYRTPSASTVLDARVLFRSLCEPLRCLTQRARSMHTRRFPPRSPLAAVLHPPCRTLRPPKWAACCSSSKVTLPSQAATPAEGHTAKRLRRHARPFLPLPAIAHGWGLRLPATPLMGQLKLLSS